MATALITGGTGGLGQEVTLTLLDAGWRCAVPFRDEEKANSLRAMADQRGHGERLSLIDADLFEIGDAKRTVELSDTPDDPLRALVNLLGGFDAPGRVHETPVERFEDQLRINLRATYLMCAACIPPMLAAGAGSIVCVSSRTALRPFSGAAGYATSKSALLTFVDALAVEYGAEGVRVNAVLPGVIDTAANRAAQPAADPGDWVAPRQIATVIEFLCSSRSEVVSGAHIPVYGRS